MPNGLLVAARRWLKRSLPQSDHFEKLLESIHGSVTDRGAPSAGAAGQTI